MLRFAALAFSKSTPKGFFFATNYRVMFFPEQNTSYFDLPLASIYRFSWNVSGGKQVLKLYAKDFRKWKLMFLQERYGASATLAHTIELYLEQYVGCSFDSLFAFSYAKQSQELAPGGFTKNLLDFSFERELQRLGMGESPWRYLNANESYALCDTYPESVVVCDRISPEQLSSLSREFSDHRFPVLAWKAEMTSTTDSSVPASKYLLRGGKILTDEYYHRPPPGLAALFEQCENSVKVFDIRPLAQFPQRSIDNVEFLNIDTIQATRENYVKMNVVIRNMKSRRELKNKTFPTQVKKLLNASLKVVHALVSSTAPQTSSKGGFKLFRKKSRDLDQIDARKYVLLTGDPDRIPQVSALVQLLLDSHFRTFQGFRELIEKEFCALGHDFVKRLGHGTTDESDFAPVFLEFLEAVSYVVITHPAYFEFTSRFLLLIADEAYSCKFGSFMSSCERVDRLRNVYEGTLSAWPRLIEKGRVYTSNPNFRAIEPFVPLERVTSVKPWTDYVFMYSSHNFDGLCFLDYYDDLAHIERIKLYSRRTAMAVAICPQVGIPEKGVLSIPEGGFVTLLDITNPGAFTLAIKFVPVASDLLPADPPFTGASSDSSPMIDWQLSEDQRSLLKELIGSLESEHVNIKQKRLSQLIHTSIASQPVRQGEGSSDAQDDTTKNSQVIFLVGTPGWVQKSYLKKIESKDLPVQFFTHNNETRVYTMEKLIKMRARLSQIQVEDFLIPAGLLLREDSKVKPIVRCTSPFAKLQAHGIDSPNPWDAAKKLISSDLMQPLYQRIVLSSSLTELPLWAASAVLETQPELTDHDHAVAQGQETAADHPSRTTRMQSSDFLLKSKPLGPIARLSIQDPAANAENVLFVSKSRTLNLSANFADLRLRANAVKSEVKSRSLLLGGREKVLFLSADHDKKERHRTSAFVETDYSPSSFSGGYGPSISPPAFELDKRKSLSSEVSDSDAQEGAESSVMKSRDEDARSKSDTDASTASSPSSRPSSPTVANKPSGPLEGDRANLIYEALCKSVMKEKEPLPPIALLKTPKKGKPADKSGSVSIEDLSRSISSSTITPKALGNTELRRKRFLERHPQDHGEWSIISRSKRVFHVNRQRRLSALLFGGLSGDSDEQPSQKKPDIVRGVSQQSPVITSFATPPQLDPADSEQSNELFEQVRRYRRQSRVVDVSAAHTNAPQQGTPCSPYHRKWSAFGATDSNLDERLKPQGVHPRPERRSPGGVRRSDAAGEGNTDAESTRLAKTEQQQEGTAAQTMGSE